MRVPPARSTTDVSVLFNEPKLLKIDVELWTTDAPGVSVLFNEPKLLKTDRPDVQQRRRRRFSALQRAEIAEKEKATMLRADYLGFSALQRAEIAETLAAQVSLYNPHSFSALQRAEIAEIEGGRAMAFRGFKFQCSSTSRNC